MILIKLIHGRWHTNDGANIWRKLWRLQVPGKIKTFLWRALNNWLPTKCNLQTRMVQVNDLCPLCGIEKETVSHCLIHCLFAKNCWNVVCPEVSFDNSLNINTWFAYVMEHLSDKTAVISTVCWGIWRARNDVVWNDRNPRAGNAYLTQWTGVQALGNIIPIVPAQPNGNLERWTKPQDKCVKVNCDATLFKSSAQFGVGWIARDDKGELICAISLCFNGRPEIHLAEAVGIREALSWIKFEEDSSRACNVHNYQLRYTVESDYQLVVGAILKQEKIYSPYGSIIDDCRCVLDSSNNIEIVADWLARSSGSSPCCILRGESVVPPELQCILDAYLNQ